MDYFDRFIYGYIAQNDTVKFVQIVKVTTTRIKIRKVHINRLIKLFFVL